MPELFFVISGEHPTLPLAELTAILTASGAKFDIKLHQFKLVEVDTNVDVSFDAANRAGYTDEAGVHVFTCEPSLDAIGQAAAAEV